MSGTLIRKRLRTMVGGVAVTVALASSTAAVANAVPGGNGADAPTAAARSTSTDPRMRNATVTSFDGTKLAVHFFPAAGSPAGGRAPTILEGPGFGNPGTTDPNAEWDPFAKNVVVGPGALRHSGYNVVTWDPRGSGSSGGTLQLNSPAYEGRDVSAIIDWVAHQREAELVKPNYPVVGMAGGSYGGGIQLVAAGLDERIRAIVPAITWNTLASSLYPQQTFKSGYASLLYALGASSGIRYAPWVTDALLGGTATGTVPADAMAHMAATAPDVAKIKVPTLLIQGTVDTLFPLRQADDNYRILHAHGVPTKMMWFCGGHGACLSSKNGQGSLIRQRTLEWLDKYVKGDSSTQTGPAFEWVDQYDHLFTAPSYPPLTGSKIVAGGGGGLLPLAPVGGSGPQLKAGAAAVTAAAPAANAINLRIRHAGPPTEILGTPQVTFSYQAVGLSTSDRVYAQIVDDSTGLVLGNQITPIPIELDGKKHTITTGLEQVAQTITPGQSLTLQITAASTAYRLTQIPAGAVDITGLSVQLPSY